MYHLDNFPQVPQVLKPIDRKRAVPGAYVRQCAFSDDGSMIICVDDASNVVQFDRVEDAMDTGNEREKEDLQRRD